MNKYKKIITHIKVGDIVTANQDATDYHLTEDKQYQVLDFDGDCILVMTDYGETEWLAKDYFFKFA